MQHRRTLHFVLASLALLASVTAVSAQCDTWRNLGALTATGYAGTPTAYVGDDVSHELYAVEQCYCGYHGINLPTVYRRSGNNWYQLTDFEQGVCNGMAMFDDGSGRALYMWGTQQAWPLFYTFMKLGPQGFGPAVNFSTPVPLSVVQFDDGTGLTFYMSTDDRVMRSNGTSWVDIGATLPANSPAVALLVHDDGTGPALYAGGWFSSIGGVAASGIARWNGTSWSPVGTGLASTPPAYTAAHVLRSFQDGATRALYVGGRFTTAGGVPANGVARWDGTTWTGLGVEIGGAGSTDVVQSVTGMEMFDEGTGAGPQLFVSGLFGSSSAFLSRKGPSAWMLVPEATTTSFWYGSPLAVFDLPETPGLDLLAAIGGPYNEHPIALAACELTGTLSCFGDGSGAACPCGNESAPSERAGCNSSLGHGGALRATGRASLTGDTLELEGSAMPNSAVLYFQGGSVVAQHVFGDGLKCTGGPFVRLSTKINQGGASLYPSGGDPALSVKGHVLAPGLRHYQLRYRNSASFCTSDTFNYTNAADILWQP